MKFKFAYENVLKNKKIQKDVAHRDMVVAQKHMEKEEDHLKNMYKLIDESRKLNSGSLKNKILTKDSIELMKWTQLFIDGQNIKIDRQKKSIRSLNQVFEEHREVLVQVAKDFKVFEKLKEKMKERHRKSEKKAEMKSNDELVVMYSKRGR